MNESSQRKFRKLYSTHKPVVKTKLNKLLASQIITSIHVRRGRVVKLKSTRYQLVVDIWIKRNFIVSYGNNVFKMILPDIKISTRLKI